MPVRISKLINRYVTPKIVQEATGRKSKLGEGQAPFMLSFSDDYKPVMTWNSTRTCNLSCVHCYSDSENKKYSGELTTVEAKKMLDDMAEFGVPILLFSGGEPLMRKDIFELMAYAKDKGIRPTLSTNGTLITPAVAKKLKDLGLHYVGISMDGFGETHDKFRGMKGAFDKMITGIHNSIGAGLKVSLRFTITKHNSPDIPKVFDLMDEHDIHRVCFYHLVYSGRGSDISRDDLTLEESRQWVDYIFDKAEEYHRRGIEKDILTIDNHTDGVYLYLKLKERDPEHAAEVYQLLKWQGGNRSGVGFGDVDYLGNVHADQFSWDYTFGNVRERKFGDIWSDVSDKIIAGYKNRKPLIKGRCSKCNFYEICNANFRARAKYATGDLWESDPACYLTDEEIGIKEPATASI